MSEAQSQPVAHHDHSLQNYTCSSYSSQLSSSSAEYSIASPIVCSGIGLHTGKYICLKLLPAPAGTGIVFRRTDKNNLCIKALYSNVIDTKLSTVIANPLYPTVRISTIEHLMAALAGNYINNVIIECDGPELPVFDGSARKYVSLLQNVEHVKYPTRAKTLKILKTVRVQDNDAFAELSPSIYKNLSLSIFINFPAKIIGKQHYSMKLTPSNFNNKIAHCRTFTFKQEIDTLLEMGLVKGGSLDNAIVVENNKIINSNGLNCKDEFVKHKMLDAIGDLSMTNMQIQGKFTGYKSGHKLNNLLLRQLMSDKKSWCVV
ncbi:UDP-3-O-acyl-N-acetylglucosamine deacetylase [Commensalibacter sp. Nvir]|uniref:UDP-3-O-acyl-N-acetylglucosamine deacetylase n=1 Tax=Commensalibacter sp. Nvir TaxID=3069817 RepID=UPI002D492F36|nr:UDP-3-O-acyl-N-acetylglucosamine deacetylase [Commensalibacter sp. Nvir]